MSFIDIDIASIVPKANLGLARQVSHKILIASVQFFISIWPFPMSSSQNRFQNEQGTNNRSKGWHLWNKVHFYKQEKDANLETLLFDRIWVD